MRASAFKVESTAAITRLDVYLAAALSIPRNQVTRMLESKLVRVNDDPDPRPSKKIQPGDDITISEPSVTEITQTPPDLSVIYEDQDLIVVDKPADLPVHSGAGLRPSPTVADFARQYSTDEDPERPGIVHRLDRDTSGLLIIAKNTPAKEFMQAVFKNRQVHKTYLLLVIGRLDLEYASIRLPLGRDKARPLQQAVVIGGRDAVTNYRVLANVTGYTYIEAKPTTGRTHQLRAHFAALGHPVVGDTTYGPPRRPLGLKRQFLHAAELEFVTPSGIPVHLESPLPPDLINGLERIGIDPQI